jgi:hypothetical protein
MQTCAAGLHALAMQTVVVVGGQSLGPVQPTTHAPLPSHTLPPLSLQGVPATALVVVHAPAVQLAILHAVAGATQLLATEQPLPRSAVADEQRIALSTHAP